MAKRTKQAPTHIAIGYVRVSTDGQGLGLAAQRTTIEQTAERLGLTLVGIEVDEGVSGAKTMRPGLTRALEQLTAHEVGTLLAAKQDRLTRSLLHLAAIMKQATDEGWRLVLADTGTDTGTETGRLVAHIMGGVSEWERSRIAERTREALAAKRASGSRLGRPIGLPNEVRSRIASMRADGATLAAIADALNTDAVPTAQGGARWYPATVSAVLRSVAIDGVVVS